MYIVDKDKNELVKAEECSFKSLGFEERKHLQEWLAKEPSSLGEDLLIIQKEFDGFSDTRERLDLLALDKHGNLVIIENKLDDSGRDVTWQAIKYASYCSSLTKDDVIKIYQSYLTSGSAVNNITEFLEVDDIKDVEINIGNSQRIFFVSAKFRKEVTSSVMWLLEFGLNIKCFKVTPYKYGDKVFIDFDQVIPIKEAEDYIIKLANKKKEESQSSAASKQNKVEHNKFWQEFIDYSKKNNGEFASSAGTSEAWLGKSIKSITGASVNIGLSQDSVRTVVYLNAGDKDKNKQIFDELLKKKDDIEKELGELTWTRNDDMVTSWIGKVRTLSYNNENDRFEIIKFFFEYSKSFLQTFGKINIKV